MCFSLENINISVISFSLFCYEIVHFITISSILYIHTLLSPCLLLLNAEAEAGGGEARELCTGPRSPLPRPDTRHFQSHSIVQTKSRDHAWLHKAWRFNPTNLPKGRQLENMGGQH